MTIGEKISKQIQSTFDINKDCPYCEKAIKDLEKVDHLLMWCKITIYPDINTVGNITGWHIELL